MKKIYEIYIRLILSTKILLSKGIIPFNILEDLNITFVLKNGRCYKNLVEWINSMYIDKTLNRITGFYVAISHKKLKQNQYFENEILPFWVIERGDCFSVFQIEKGNKENEFIVREKIDYAYRGEDYSNKLENALKPVKENNSFLQHNYELLCGKMPNSDEIPNFVDSLKNILSKREFSNIVALLNFIEFIEKPENKDFALNFYGYFLDKFCSVINSCIFSSFSKSNITIGNLCEKIIFNCVTNKDFDDNVIFQNIKVAIGEVSNFYILIDENSKIKKEYKNFAKPFIQYSDDKTPKIFLALSLESVYETESYFDEEAEHSNEKNTLKFTIASIQQIKELCELSKIEPKLTFTIYLPDYELISISARAIQSFFAKKEDEKKETTELEEKIKNDKLKNKKPKNKKLRFFFVFLIFSILIFVISQLFHSDFVVKKYMGGFCLKEYRGSAKELVFKPKKNLTVIGRSAFYLNKTIKKLEIKDGIKFIHSEAFYKTKIKTLILPKTLLEIDDNVFCKMPYLEEIEIPISVYSIGENFNDCENLKKIKIGKHLYQKYKDNLHLHKNVEYEFLDDSKTFDLEQYLEYDETKTILIKCKIPFETSFTIPSNVKKIKSNAFSNTRVTEVIIQDSVEEIEVKAFLSERNLESVTIGNGIKEIPPQAFENCAVLSKINFGKNIEKIGDRAFKNCRDLLSITLPENLKEIEKMAFMNCKNLETVELSNKILTIGSYAFSSCNFENFIIPDSVIEIGNNCFFDCKNLKNIKLSQNITKVSEGAISYCYALDNVIIPDSVKKIEKNAFYKCKNLKNIKLNKDLEEIGESAFENCINLESITIPDSVKDIGNLAFSTCKKLSLMKLSSNLETLGEFAFFNCEELKEIDLGNNLNEIKFETFSNCIILSSINIPDSVKRINDGVFRNCLSLSNVDLGNGVNFLGDNLFENSKISTIKIPKSVKLLNGKTFNKCFELKTIYIENEKINFMNKEKFKGIDLIF